MNRYCFLLVLPVLSVSTLGFAEPVSTSNYWKCTTQDASNTEWSAKNMYQKVALNFAFASCKQHSKDPASCKTSTANCAHFMNGEMISPMWRCTALDGAAMAWQSDRYAEGEDAALAAKAYCRERSSVPDTCYINMLTCTNINGM